MRGGHAADNDRSCPTQLVHICALRRTHFGCGCRFVAFLANCAENSLSPQMGVSTLTRYIGRLGWRFPQSRGAYRKDLWRWSNITIKPRAAHERRHGRELDSRDADG